MSNLKSMTVAAVTLRSGRRRSVRTDSNIELVEEREIPVSLAISRGLLLVPGCPSWLQISLTNSIFESVLTE